MWCIPAVPAPFHIVLAFMAASLSRLGGLLCRHAPRLLGGGVRRPLVELPALHVALRWSQSVPQARNVASAAGEGGSDDVATAAAAAPRGGQASAAPAQGVILDAVPASDSFEQWSAAWQSFLQQLYEQVRLAGPTDRLLWRLPHVRCACSRTLRTTLSS